MKKLLQSRQLIISLALGVFFSFFLSVENLFSQCTPQYPDYYNAPGINKAFITRGGDFGSPINPVLWVQSAGLWTECKGRSNFFRTNRYPQIYFEKLNNDANNIYIEIKAGHHLKVDRIRLGNNVNLIVCGYLEVGDFEGPPVDLIVLKTANKQIFSNVGDIIDYSIEVINNSTSVITDLTIKDPLVGLDIILTTLDGGSTQVFSGSYVVTVNDLSKGYVENTVHVTGMSFYGHPLDAEDTEIVYGPLSVSKTADKPFFTNESEVITYTINVTNNGTVSITNVSVVDPLTGLDFLIDFIDPGITQPVITTYSILVTDLTKGFVENNVTVTGYIGGDEVSSTDSEVIFFQPLKVIKTPSEPTFSDVGEQIIYEIIVQNNSDIAVGNILIEDPLTGFEETRVEPLNPGLSVSYPTIYTITESDLINGQVYNVARASSIDGNFAFSEGSCLITSSDSPKMFAQEIENVEFVGTSKADPAGNSAFNNVNLIICPGGILIMERLQVMNNSYIQNDGVFIVNSIEGKQANMCMTGSGYYYNHNGELIIDDEGILLIPGVVDGNWMTGENCDIPLPIELLSFTPQIKPDRIDLLWTTGSEINNDYFTIERSLDLYGWDILGFVQGAGNSSVPLNYIFSDMQPLDGLAYYRLKQTDFDGKFEYFGPIAAHYDLGLAGLEFKVIKQYSNWIIAVPNDGQYQVEVYSLTGRRLVSEKVENNLTIPAPEGGVVIRVTDGYARSASRVVM